MLLSADSLPALFQLTSCGQLPGKPPREANPLSSMPRFTI